MVLRSHVLAGAWIGPYGGTNELEPAKALRESIPDHSLTVVDRAFLAATLLLGIQASGENRHWLTRARSSNRWRVLRRLGKGDELVEMDVSKAARTKGPSLPKTWTMRAIRYQRKGFRPSVLLTSLLDAEAYPASDVIRLSVTSSGAIPKRLASMRANIKRYILPPRRPRRSYPRAVKIKMSNYARKRPAVETSAK